MPEETFAIPGVGGLIRRIRDGEEFLLVQERCKADAPDETGLIEIPAGKVRAFECVYDTLRREVLEETGYRVVRIEGESEGTVVRQHGYNVIHSTPYACSQNLSGSYPIMVLVFVCEVDGTPLAASDEARNIRWVRLEDLAQRLQDDPQAFYPMHLDTLKRYCRERLTPRG